MATVTITPCPNCSVTVKNGRVRWLCDDYHPELARVFLDQQGTGYGEEKAVIRPGSKSGWNRRGGEELA